MKSSEIINNKQKLITLEGILLERRALLDRDKKRISAPLPESLDDLAAAIENDEVVDRLDEQLQGELKNVNLALRRIRRGVFGVCTSCGNAIKAKRLKAVSYAANCMKCENEKLSKTGKLPTLDKSKLKRRVLNLL